MAKKETVIQFGEGGFLRGFVDYFFQKLKDKGMFDGYVVVVQPIEKGMCEMLEKQNCEYNLFLRGIDNGQVVDELFGIISSITHSGHPRTMLTGLAFQHSMVNLTAYILRQQSEQYFFGTGLINIVDDPFTFTRFGLFRFWCF